MWNQSTCLNTSITLSKLPIMIQTQIQATNMRWGGMTLKNLQPCLMPMPNTTIHDIWLSHYNCQTKMWWPNLDDWKRNLCKRESLNNWLELDVKSINLPQCINSSIRTSNYDANTNLSNQYEMRREDLKFATLFHVNAEYNYSPQLSLTL